MHLRCCFILILAFFSVTQLSHATTLTWLDPAQPTIINKFNLNKANVTPPPREFFSLNTIYLGNKIEVNVGFDLINQNYVVMPSPNVRKVEKVGDKQRVTIQQYFPNLESKILDNYKIAPSKLAYLYITKYEVYDQNKNLVDRILVPDGTQFKPPQFYTVDVANNVKTLSFVFTFNSRTGWSDTGVSSNIQGLYNNLTEIAVDRDSAIHLVADAGHGLKTYEVLTSHENQKLQKILAEFHHIVVWGRISHKEDLVNKILDLKKFEEIDIDLAKGIESLEQHPLIFGDPLNPKWQSIINHISSEHLTEREMSREGSVSAKLGLKQFFNFDGSSSKKRSSRFKDIVKFDFDGTLYVPKALKFVTRINDSFELIKSLVFQAYDQLEEANYSLAGVVSLDQNVPRVTSDHLYAGEELKRGESISSNNGKYELVMQEDGNLVLYKIHEHSIEALWSSGTCGKAVHRCVMQNDGNLVIYGYFGEAWWNSGTFGHAGAFLMMQDDGNLVIYHHDNKPLWYTRTR